MNNHLVNRERERADLTAFISEPGSGRSALLLVAGEAGVGKSTLVRAVMADLDQHALEAGSSQDGTPPYAPIVSVLRQLHRRGRLRVKGPLRSRLATIMPELGQATALGDRATLVEAIVTALAAAEPADGLTVFLDDLQWADNATLELLPGLAQALEQDRVRIVGAYRSDELPRAHAIRRLRTELRRAGRLRELTVGPFDMDGTATLLTVTMGSAVARPLIAAVFNRTDGVAFFVEELCLALSASARLRPGSEGLELATGNDLPIPDSVPDAVMLQTAGLSPAARTAAMTAAVVGQEFSPRLVTDVAELDAWPDELVDHGVVVDVASGVVGFRHALIRDAFYAEVPWTRRIELHRRTAERLESSGAFTIVVAEHWVRAREPARACRCLVQAAGASRLVHAYQDERNALLRAIELWPQGAGDDDRLGVLEQLAECAELTGNLADATAVWREAENVAGNAADPFRLGDVRRRLATVLELQGRWEEALALREDAARAFDSAGAPADAAGERLAAAAHLRSAARFRAALHLLERARPDADEAGRLDLRMRVLALEGNVRARMGEGAAAVGLVHSALTTALDNGLTGVAGEIYQRLADSQEHAGDYGSARETYDTAFGYCQTNVLVPTAQLCLACLAVVLRQAGDWDRAAAVCREVIGSAESSAHARAVATGTLGTILAVRGQSRGARPLLIESASLARGIELAAMELLAAWGLALLDEARGETASAATRCTALLERWEATEDRHYAISALRWACTHLAEAANADGTSACVAALGRIAADAPGNEALSAFAHGLGERALLNGDSDQALAQFVRSIELLRGVGAPFERIGSERRAARALTLAGRRDEAVERLVTAYRLAQRLKSRPLAAKLAGEVAALGDKAERRLGRRAPAAQIAGSLTRRETEVVRLVAVGRTNREIATELFLSPRTVEMHVQSILLKLDCRSRMDAARRATELGLVPAPLARDGRGQ